MSSTTQRGLTQALGAMPTRIAILIVAALALIGCAKPLGLVLPKDKPLTLEIYSRGASFQSCTIAPGSPQFKQLEELLAGSPDDWAPTPVTFVPSVLVTGPNFSINFLQDFAVVNYADGQFKHHMPKSAYAFLGCANGT